MPLTTEELLDLRADLGDNGTARAFTDDELERLFVRANERYAVAMVLALNQLLASAAKLNDYTQNETQEKKSQVFEQLVKLRAFWQLEATRSSPPRQVRVAQLGVRPPRERDEPYA